MVTTLLKACEVCIKKAVQPADADPDKCHSTGNSTEQRQEESRR